MTSDVLIRHAAPEDLGAIHDMGARFHASTCYADLIPVCLDSFLDTITTLATAPRGVVLVAERDGHVIGMAAAFANPHWFNAKHLAGQELFWWVEPEHRGSRAGALLMAGLENWAAGVGCKTFSMASTANLKPASLSRLYARRGYVPQDIYFGKVISCQGQ